MRIQYNFFRASCPTILFSLGVRNASVQTVLTRIGAVCSADFHSVGNLPGWRWARIKQLALVGLSSSRHSEVCNALGCTSGVAHSIISVHGISRPRGCQQFILLHFLGLRRRRPDGIPDERSSGGDGDMGFERRLYSNRITSVVISLFRT
jgi:hypothetical protein